MFRLYLIIQPEATIVMPDTIKTDKLGLIAEIEPEGV